MQYVSTTIRISWSLYYYVSFKFFSGTKFKLVGFLYYLNEKSFTLNDIANV